MAGFTEIFRNRMAELALAGERRLNGLFHCIGEVDGDTWHYLDGGPRNQPAVLLLHGFAANKDNWTRFSGRVARKHRVIAPDLPGFGQSSRHLGARYTLAVQRERLHAFVRRLGLERFHIVGSSMGGHLALLYAHAHPEQIITLGLFNNAGITSARPSKMVVALSRGENLLLTSSIEDFDRVLTLVVHHRPFIPWPVKRYLAELAVAARDFNAYIFDQYRSELEHGVESILPEVKAPVFILWGRNDRVLDVSSVDVMRPRLPQAEVVIMEHTGHLPMLERPGQTAAHYLTFVGRHT